MLSLSPAQLHHERLKCKDQALTHGVHRISQVTAPGSATGSAEVTRRVDSREASIVMTEIGVLGISVYCMKVDCCDWCNKKPNS